MGLGEFFTEICSFRAYFRLDGPGIEVDFVLKSNHILLL
ncbi:protein of unknown function [Kyrpidia spormannii]|uniref:Uncharacterized protein n=1 Tax=Kyrpidia spormannii TaxID=2055160 RepID=A0ACA8Z7G3_9BACL|nr:protein of unknown function [Kyrpidia spormannii]